MSKSKERIRESQLRYKQGLGQNFLYDDALLQALVDLAEVTEDDDVLQVGPGSGSMTRFLCERAHSVTSIELDDRLIPLLGAFMEPYHNFRLIHGDVMQVNLPEVTQGMKKPFKVVANIPYYITTPLIQMLLSSGLDIASMSLMVQKQVADKILSGPGEDGWGMLAVKCQYLCEPYLAMDVPAACFTPRPKVDSAFVVLPRREKPAVDVVDENLFFRVAGAAFALRRKTMVNNLCATFHMERAEAVEMIIEAGLDEKVRGEKLTLQQLADLANVMANKKA